MAREKKPVHKVQMTEGKRNIIRQLLEEYDIESAQDIQDALKDLLGGTIKEMMEVEMDYHLGYSKSELSAIPLGNTLSSIPHINTYGNSRPLALWRVISLT